MPLTTFQNFVWQHRDDDPRQLALSASKHADISVAEAAAQVQALQKIRHKIPSWYRAGMEFPLAVSVEQASSEKTARFKASLFSGEKMADLTGGLGVDAFFFSQQFEVLTYVEQNAKLLAAARHNFAQLGASNVHFEHGTAEVFLGETKDVFDLIYLDPARRDGSGGRVSQLADCSPDVLKIKELLLEKSPRVLLKTAPMLDLRLAAQQLGAVTKIWVVASEGECREVLYLLGREAGPLGEIPIEAVALESRPFSKPYRSDEPPVFVFTWAEEQQAKSPISGPQNFLYEPNPAVLKAGAFRLFGQRFGLAKIHANTHLYTSGEFCAGLPARGFAIEQVCRYDRKAVQAAVPGGKANIACRNFPDKPEQVRTKLGLADGGDVYLFGVTDFENKRVVMVCKKV